MENDVLYNRIMNVVHEEYGSGSTAVANPEGEATDDLEKIQIGDDIYSISNVLTLELTQVEDGIDIGASFNELKEAFLSGRKIITHLEFEIESTSWETWSNLNIIELMESETGDTPTYYINLSLSVDETDFAYTNTVEDPTENIIATT